VAESVGSFCDRLEAACFSHRGVAIPRHLRRFEVESELRNRGLALVADERVGRYCAMPADVVEDALEEGGIDG
jgi:hypothetical protein